MLPRRGGVSVKRPTAKRPATRPKAAAAAVAARAARAPKSRHGSAPPSEEPIAGPALLTIEGEGAFEAIAIAAEAEPDATSQEEPAAVSDVVAQDAADQTDETRPAAQILIEIDPNVSAGFINNRYDLEVRGWVVSSSPVEEVALLHEDTVTSRVQYGPPAPSARIKLPDGTTVTRHVFTLLLPRLRSAAVGPCDIAIDVRTADGQTHREYFSLTIDPLLPTQVRVQSGPTRSSADYAGELPPVVLFIERAALDPTGYLQMVGWAVSMATLVAIQVFAGEERVSSPRLGTRRDDVAGVFPSYPNALQSGFILSTPLNETAWAARTIRAQAICADGFAHEIVVPLERVARAAPPPPVYRPPPQPPPPPAPSPSEVALPRQDPPYRLVAGFSVSSDVLAAAASLPLPTQPSPPPVPPEKEPKQQDQRRVIQHFCDVASLSVDGEVVVDGWAVCAIGIAAVEVWLDDQRLGDAELGLPREDVGEQFPTIPMARYSGFRFLTHVPLPADGEHRLRIILRNGLDDEEEDVSVHFIERPKPPPIIEAPPEFRFEIDSPAMANGVVVEPITGRLTIEGWVLSRSGVAEMVVWLDDQRLGEAHYGLARQDVGNAFPEWPNALRSGYAFHCPPRSLRNGEHMVKISVRALNGEELHRSFRIEVRKPEGSDETVAIRRRMPLVEADVLTESLAKLDYRPSFRLVLRQNGPMDAAQLACTLASLGSQAYRDWRMTALAEDADSAAAIRAGLAAQPSEIADRVTVFDASAIGTEGGIQLDTPFGANEPTAGPRLFGLLCPGDELGGDALMEFALASGRSRGADFLYADEIRISSASREREPFCKPDFSPDLLLSTNYVGRPWFATPDLLAKAEVTPRSLLRDAEYDIVLRCTEQAASVHHIPKLLCRRGSENLDSDNAARGALRRAAARRGFQADVLDTTVRGTFRLRRRKRASGKVSIIIPTCAAHGYIEACVRTLRDHTAYRNFEIVCVDNIPPQQVGWKRWLRDNADKVVDIPESFNWARFNNRAAEHAAGDYFLFLNDDIEVIDPQWLDALLEHAQRPEVGVAGARLLYPGGKVQHAGMFLATTGVARHAFRFAAENEPGYFGLALTQRNVIAVTGACMLVRRDVFESLGRFDEAHEVVNNDLDFCLRAHTAGLSTVFTPYARLVHHELASRDQVKETFDTSHFERQWKSLFTSGDPYFSPLLSRHADDYRPDDEPVESVFAGHPLFRRDDIKRILVVKLDHIGDFITALPAMRRLKHHFPTATIHVLAARGARSFAETETCIDGFLEFEFFHARSGLGQKELTDDDYAELRARLLPYGFDLAIDLRKHPDTRETLRHVPARFLAGFDHMGQFPFLDVALEWEGDKNLQRKRSHVTDDLLNLVEAVGTAASQERNSLIAPSWPAPTLPDFLTEEVRSLFAKPVVAVHPGVGTVMRQWPVEHFAALIDLLVEAAEVNAIIVGGPDEVQLAQEVLDKTVHQTAVASLAGRTSMSQLTDLLACCALFVGNNSGPKHIAAAIGVPTIGVHAGVIDPTEWAPIGKRAMALRRNMTCSPCYLARQQDCPRNLACLRQLEPALVWQACQALLGTSRVSVKTFVRPAPEEAPSGAGVEPQDVTAQPSEQAVLPRTFARHGSRRQRAVSAEAPSDTAAVDSAVTEATIESAAAMQDAEEPVVEPPRRGRKRSVPKPAGAEEPSDAAAAAAPDALSPPREPLPPEPSPVPSVEEPTAQPARRGRRRGAPKPVAAEDPSDVAAAAAPAVPPPEPPSMPLLEEPTAEPARRGRKRGAAKPVAAENPSDAAAAAAPAGSYAVSRPQHSTMPRRQPELQRRSGSKKR